jgi:hypothetical protein
MTSLSITHESFVNKIDWSEIAGFHLKYMSVIIVFIQLHVMCTTVTWYCLALNGRAIFL